MSTPSTMRLTWTSLAMKPASGPVAAITQVQRLKPCTSMQACYGCGQMRAMCRASSTTARTLNRGMRQRLSAVPIAARSRSSSDAALESISSAHRLSTALERISSSSYNPSKTNCPTSILLMRPYLLRLDTPVRDPVAAMGIKWMHMHMMSLARLDFPWAEGGDYAVTPFEETLAVTSIGSGTEAFGEQLAKSIDTDVVLQITREHMKDREAEVPPGLRGIHRETSRRVGQD